MLSGCSDDMSSTILGCVGGRREGSWIETQDKPEKLRFGQHRH